MILRILTKGTACVGLQEGVCIWRFKLDVHILLSGDAYAGMYDTQAN
jgi:hypothetical protein